MKLSLTNTLLALAAPAVRAEPPSLSSWSDRDLDLTFQIAIQNKTEAPFALIMSIIAPKSVTWAGFATGACMLRSPLLVAWPNGTGVAVAARWATQFHPPVPYTKTAIDVFQSSGSNATHWHADFVCWDGCSSWLGGAIDPNFFNSSFGYAASTRPVASPANINGSIPFHDLAREHFDFDITKAKRSSGDFDALIRAAGPTVAW